MTDPTWMLHQSCGYCPVDFNDLERRGQRCHYGCHPGQDCAPTHEVGRVAKPPLSTTPSYKQMCPTCRRNYSGSWRSHRCEVAS